MPYEAPTPTFSSRLKSRFILLTLLAGFVFNLLPWRDPRAVPDLVALAILFWSVHQPRRMGMGIAFLCGLLMDAANGVLLGQHALAYSLLAYAGSTLSRRILGFAVWAQAAHAVVLIMMMQTAMLTVRMIAGGTFPGWSYFIGGLGTALLWPLAAVALVLAERAAESDQSPSL